MSRWGSAQQKARDRLSGIHPDSVTLSPSKWHQIRLVGPGWLASNVGCCPEHNILFLAQPGTQIIILASNQTPTRFRPPGRSLHKHPPLLICAAHDQEAVAGLRLESSTSGGYHYVAPD